MIDKFAKEFRQTAYNACARFAKQMGLSTNEMQLKFAIEQIEGDFYLSYVLLHKYKKVKDVSFKDILGVKIDFLNRENMTIPFISKALEIFAEEHQVPCTEIFICAAPDDGARDKVRMWLYRIDGQHIKHFEIEPLFGAEVED